MSDDVLIHRGFPQTLRSDAAALYDAAFGAKLAVAIPERRRRLEVLQKAFDPHYSFAAVACGRLVGIAGFKTETGSLTGGMTFEGLKAALGPARAVRAAAVLLLYKRDLAPGQLLMDGISVSPEMRAKGVGTLLLQALKELAKQEQYHTIRLDVIDTNPGARRLYERLGFVETGTTRFGYLRWLLGFSAATTLEYRVPAGN